MRIKLFADTADIGTIEGLARDPGIAGFTTNPTLMRAGGVADYETFARDAIDAAIGKPVSFEVVSDDLAGMAREARTIHSWGGNTFVKIPVTNTEARPTTGVIEQLSSEGLPLNITAVMTIGQVEAIARALGSETHAIISVFAGRIADTGRDPEPVMRECVNLIAERPNIELLWASPREIFNLVQAERCGCHIITATPDLLAKRHLFGRDLHDFSLETVGMFRRDAVAAGYDLEDADGTPRNSSNPTTRKPTMVAMP